MDAYGPATKRPVRTRAGRFAIPAAAGRLSPSGLTRPAEAASSVSLTTAGTRAPLFALGIVGAGLLAVPVLAGSAAYGVGEAFAGRRTSNERPRRRRPSTLRSLRRRRRACT